MNPFSGWMWGLKVLILLEFKSEISWTTSVSLCRQCKAAWGLRPTSGMVTSWADQCTYFYHWKANPTTTMLVSVYQTTLI